ncbi:unnamed protein product [Rotaria socialis]|uniref:DUF19 domain-containing protein n=3 Tax=Rotaria socialis TaxID=392032 RepID=A0A818Q5J9_9BILA|nr:unnamed protein product [Rotaria socialis]CAF3632821.1 unnamed protein product [Rotaria socialis]
MLKAVRFATLLVYFIICVNGSKKSWLSAKEINKCLEKSKELNTGCDFIKCFHERYKCNAESVTAWAHELCQSFPKEIILQFTPPGRQMMINIQNCTQNFLARTYRQRKKLNCDGFETKYFSQVTKCYAYEKNFCQVFKDNRQIFMQQATTVMLKKPRALQAFSIAGKNCTRFSYS